MVRRFRHIALLFTLLLLSGMATPAWADDVTYIILTKPFNVRNAANTANYRENIRLEALRCSSTGTTVYLPDEFRSPLAKNFKYWKTPTVTMNTRLYETNGTTPDVLITRYDIYTAVTDEMTESSTLADNDNPTTIYVTYEYDEDNTILKLDGAHKYNITLNSGNNLRYLCFNKNRANRPAAAKATTVSAEDLVSDDFVQNVNGFDGTKMVHYQFYLCGEDPYNITIMTAYEGNETFSEDLEVEKGKKYMKPYRGSTIFAKLNNNNNNDGTANMWLSPDAHRHYKSTTDATVYDSWEGFYRSNMNPIFNAVAVLPKGTGYFFVASKLNQNGTIYQPNASGNYATLSDDGKNPRMLFKAIESAVPMDPDPVRTYTFKVKTPFGNVISADKEWSEAYDAQSLIANLPDAIKRKYVTFDGAYKEEGLSTPLTTFADANTNATVEDGKFVIWLKYTSSMPFESLPVDGSYTDARWYTIRANNTDANMVYYYNEGAADKFYTGLGSNINQHQGESEGLKTQVAFLGDPFELKIINHQASHDGSANRYIGCATGATLETTTLSSQTGSSDISTWEIAYDESSGSMVLRQYGTYANPKYIGWNSTGNKPIIYSATSTRLKVVALEKKNYVYHIVRNDAGDIAIKQTKAQDIGIPLKLTNIPDTIRSPFLTLGGYTVTYYWTLADAKTKTNAKIHAPFDASTEGLDIYVRYESGTDRLTGTYNVRLNGEYIYYDTETSSLKSVTSLGDNATNPHYQWHLAGSDPYAMLVRNEGLNKYIKVNSWANNAELEWETDAANASKFVAMSSTFSGVYEVMAATGDGVDAATTYYHIGRYDNTTIRMYDNATYAHGYNQLRFLLTSTAATDVVYHLIDKDKHDLLQVTSRHISTDAPRFPTDYWCPLVSSYHYYLKTDFEVTDGLDGIADNADDEYTLNGGSSELTTIGANAHVYVTYDVTNSVDMLNKKTMYLLRFAQGTPFKAEDGSDGLEEVPVTPVYPYCNGDCNFFVYGQDQFDLQQQGAASTRTRWAWYLESANNDPYHVKICSRQTETYNNDELRAYFCTYQPTSYNQVVTGLVWPSISGIQGTEYMIIGSSSLYRLETTNPVALDADHNGTPESTQRYTVKSFEQYWKTYDTVRRKILKQGANDYPANPNDPDRVPATPYVVGDEEYTSNRDYLTDEMGFHCYSKWAYAKRWNGYNISGKTSKGWEEIEHWFQTVNMGEGYFTLVPIDINPVLILLDQHGWEIMRKPLPTSPDDDTKDAKYDAIRPYNSPMVKEYYFWTKASKRSGFHQYYNLSQQVYNEGKPFTSTSLTDLPPYYTATNLHDAKGNHLDEYVTYSVKDEYVQSYSVEYTYKGTTDTITDVTGTGAPFLIQQGTNYASYDGSSLTTPSVPSPDGMPKHIVDAITAGSLSNNELWFVKPNTLIDYEMGYVDASETTTLNHDWLNDYDDKTKVKASGFNSWAFDPYNIQISSVAHNSKYFVTNATGATLEEGAGSLKGTYDVDPTVLLGIPEDDIPCSWYDSRALAITDATFMAVQDAEGNMQLMPRFDHDRRMKDFSTLILPSDLEIAQTHTKLYRPLVYNYHIIDNQGRESLRYRSGGDLVPQTPDHFKSPLAKNYTYYKTLTEGVVSGEITESLAGAELATEGSAGNDVYVRYRYDLGADALGILEGRWLTMTLNGKNVQYKTVSETAGIYADDDDTPTKPATIDGSAKTWQWKFLKTPQTDSDPYAVQLFNRNNKGNELPTGKRFALLSHAANGSYALAEAGTTNDNYDTYNFLNGGGTMETNVAATTARESGFLSTSCSFSGTYSQIMLMDEVTHEFTYNIYTNNGKFAISAMQEYATLKDNDYEPKLPETIMSPLLNADQFVYYNMDDLTITDGNITTADTAGKALTHVYGLYDDEICVRYTAYDPLATTYKVPNVRNTTGSGQVERANTSNDASIGINNEYLYNIIWHNDNMMTGNSDNTITDGGSQELGGSPSGQVWHFAGNDPYAIKLRTAVGSPTLTSRFVTQGSTNLELTTTEDNATIFMLLPREDNYEYGMLQVTGGTGKLTGYGNTLTSGDAVPTKFIIFALSTHLVTYHLVIANINSQVTLYDYNNQPVITVDGTTQRDLSTYPIADYAAGHVSLGDPLKVPTQMYRRNVDYFFYVGDIFNVDAYGADNGKNNELTARYKGHCVTAMGDDPDLVGKHVHIYIVYTFQGGLATNAGDGFVTNVTQNKWYTFEAKKADGTPLLTQYTNAWGMEVKEGRGTHYTNDYLWSPIGDPYGFKMFHRYTYVNSGSNNQGEPHRVMTTSTPNPFTNGKPVTMGNDNDVSDANSVYELLADEYTTQGYFKIHPVANSAGDQYYFKIFHDWENPEDHTTPEHDYVRLSSDADYTEFTFGLSDELIKPYIDRMNYVGGLKSDVANSEDFGSSHINVKELITALKKGTATAAQLMKLQSIVYDPDNIVKYEPGYYRLHSPEDIEGVTVRYASGYTHKRELDYDNNASADADGDGNNIDAIPMHFYERKGVNTTFEILANGFTRSAATQGAIPISEPMYDPASVFYFYEGTSSNPMSRVQTQGLYVKGTKGPGLDKDNGNAVIEANVEAANERAAAIMTTNSAEATPLYIMDIGGAILLIHDNVTGERRGYLKYLSFDQNEANHIYDLKLTHNTHTDHAKWLMEPVNAQGITLSVNSGGDAGEYGTTYYYSTWYAPFDVLLPNDEEAKRYVAYTCVEGDSPWPVTALATTGYLYPKPIGTYNTGTYAGNNKFIPAGTPALIATTDNAGVIKMTIPTSSPSSSISTIFTGQNLEQLLSTSNTIYSFGLPFTSVLEMNEGTGEIIGTLPTQADNGIGFYINANPNKEIGPSRDSWTRNNRYVLHNKIYYRATGGGGGAPDQMRDIQFVPVLFDDGDDDPNQDEDEPQPDDNRPNRIGDGCIYDILGRKVATAAEVQNGTWRQRLNPGIYIIDGQKIYVSN